MRTAEWTDSTSVLDRVTAVLDAFGDDDGLGVSEIARRANLPKSTVSRIVADLVRQRYLDREGATVHLGLKLFELGQSVERPMALRRLAHPVMNQLRSVTGASVRLAVLDGANVVIIGSIGSPTEEDNPVTTGARYPAHSSALGRAILALSSGPLHEELVEVRRSGVASAPEVPTGATCVASAICPNGSAPVGAIGVAGPGAVIDERRVGGLVRAAAAAIGRQWTLHSS